ncbi:interleukin-6 receptor subunit beta [Halichoeres trimaculatus]|uniref:interleukin-6 receptor subunit beta n=1 Tax=Halichoeres trimaculatus TaxID=147232 RepID=UPI003D9F3F61
MEQSAAVMWTCLLGATFALAASLTSSNTDPRPPRLIDCVFMNRANVTCRWEPGDPPATRYTLQVQRIPGIRRLNISSKLPLTTFSCTTSGSSCTAALSGSSVSFTFCVSVTAHSASQSEHATSERRCQSGRLEVELPAVALSAVKQVKGHPRCLNVTWSGGLVDFPVSLPEIRAGNLTSQIQFTEGGQFDVQVRDVAVRDRSFLVCVFRPDTSYSVRLRHRFMGATSPWSQWSNEVWGGTAEDAPSAAPAFWREVKHADESGWRPSSLLWQPLRRSVANGRVLFYNVTCETSSSHALRDHGSCTDLDHSVTSCSLLLPAGRCSCSLTASTSGGASPEAHVWLLGASEAEPPSPSLLSVTPLDDSRLDVRWAAPAGWSPGGYVVEWRSVTEKNSNVLRWRRLNSSCTTVVISEGVRPLERFAVSVRALYGEKGAGQNRTVYVYTRQGAPSAGPSVEVKQISGSTVKLTWTPVPVELLHGFIRNYTLHFTSETQPARSVCVPAHTLSYSLKNLSPGVYDIFMQANTEAGAGAAGPVTNVHIGSADLSVVVWVVLPLILASLGLVMVACLAQTKMVKEKLFQDVPDPSLSSLAHWTPKPALEGSAWPAAAGKLELRYSEVVLLGESELLDSDLSYQSVRHLHTFSLNRYAQLPASANQTPQSSTESEKLTESLTKARSSSDAAVYSDVLLSPTLQSQQEPPPPPPLPLSVSVDGVEPQLEGDRALNVSPHSESPLSQSSDSSSVSICSVSPPRQASFESVYNPAPSLQPRPDHLCGTMLLLPFPRPVFVDMTYCAAGYDPYVSPAV